MAASGLQFSPMLRSLSQQNFEFESSGGLATVEDFLRAALEQHEREVADLSMELINLKTRVPRTGSAVETADLSTASMTGPAIQSKMVKQPDSQEVNDFPEFDVEVRWGVTSTLEFDTGKEEHFPYSNWDTASRVTPSINGDSADIESRKAKQGWKRSNSVVAGSLSSMLQPKKEIPPFTRFVQGPFDRLCSVVIILNVVCVCLELQYEGCLTGRELGYPDVAVWPGTDYLFDVIGHVFNAFFALELVMRLAAQRWAYVWTPEMGLDKFNLLDVFLVVATSIDLYVLTPSSFYGGAVSLTVMRPFRFLRLLRTLRVVRTLKLFSKLTALVNTVAASFMALFWSIVLLTVTQLLAALFLCQSLASSLEDEGISLPTRLWLFQMYGTSFRSFWTVFELTFSGGWPNYARTVVEEVSALYSVFFFVYIIAVTFAMFRIITALFLRDTLALAANDAELVVEEKMKQKQSYSEKLLDFFHRADTNQDGMLSFAEFDLIMRDDKVKTWLSVMEVDIHEPREFFETLAGGHHVSPDEFVQGIMRLKGGAKAQDVMATFRLCQHMAKVLANFMRRLEAMEELNRSQQQQQQKLQQQMKDKKRLSNPKASSEPVAMLF